VTTLRPGVLAGILVLLIAPGADAHRRRAPRPSWRPAFETYTAFKAGGFDADGLDAPGEGGFGLFLGAEWGIAPAPGLELGMALDWFHREAGQRTLLLDDGSYGPPVELVAADGTSSDLLPFGAVVRAKLPVGDGRLVPFLAGHLGIDVLRLAYRTAPGPGAPGHDEAVEWFHGLGSGVSMGVEAGLGPGASLLFEAGLHESEPHRDLRIDGVPVQARVDADGEFVRAGVKLAF
jgi:hypothetical protein